MVAAGERPFDFLPSLRAADALKLLQEVELVAEGTFTDKFETHGKLIGPFPPRVLFYNWNISQICLHLSDLAPKMLSFSRNTWARTARQSSQFLKPCSSGSPPTVVM